MHHLDGHARLRVGEQKKKSLDDHVDSPKQIQQCDCVGVVMKHTNSHFYIFQFKRE